MAGTWLWTKLTEHHPGMSAVFQLHDGQRECLMGNAEMWGHLVLSWESHPRVLPGGGRAQLKDLSWSESPFTTKLSFKKTWWENVLSCRRGRRMPIIRRKIWMCPLFLSLPGFPGTVNSRLHYYTENPAPSQLPVPKPPCKLPLGNGPAKSRRGPGRLPGCAVLGSFIQ